MYLTLLVVLECVLDNGSYAGIAWVVLFFGIWAFVAVPVYCAKYSKVIHKEKYKYLFAVYNSLVLPLLHFRLHKIGILFFFWTLGLTVLFLVLRTRSEKQAKMLFSIFAFLWLFELKYDQSNE